MSDRERKLHVRAKDNVAERLGFTAPDLCLADGETWPCPTVVALDAQRPARGTVERAERDAAAATATGHTVGCMCYGCEDARGGSGEPWLI